MATVSDKRQFVDPSIATAVMQANQDSILQDFNYFGFLFESLCTRDMRVYAQANNGDVFHYRDKDELESDLIVQQNVTDILGLEFKQTQHKHNHKCDGFSPDIACKTFSLG